MYVCARARTSNPVTADLQSAVNECHLYSTAVLNLNTVFFYSFCSLSFMYFLYRQKVPKSSAHGKNLHKRPLLRPHNVSLRSVVCSSLQAFGCFQGAAELNFV